MPIFDCVTFQDDGLVPAVIVDDVGGQVLTLCYMNEDALAKTLETGQVHVFRRSQGRVMKKGETSGHTQAVKAVLIDCEGNSLVIRVDQKVAACHTGHFTCYFTKYNPQTDTTETIGEKAFEPKDVY
ncbi:MAG: phosphoribosyl-AMP cyclohydrolase [Planctomycetota bacterium]